MVNVSETGYGVDVAATRADDLDKRLLAFVKEHPDCRVLDLGCGAGGAAARLVAAGAQVTGIDQFNFSGAWKLIEGPVQFIQGDMREFQALTKEQVFDVCVLQRVIHYLPYDAAKGLLRELSPQVDTLYVSFSGLTSELGAMYQDTKKPVSRRFCKLSHAQQETFGIVAPLCLYTESEAVTLLESAGWHIEWARTSDFGNVKVVAGK